MPKVLEKSQSLDTANCPLSWRHIQLGWRPNRGMSPLFWSMFKKLAGNQGIDEFLYWYNGVPKVLEKSHTLDTTNCPCFLAPFQSRMMAQSGYVSIFLSMFKKLAGNKVIGEYQYRCIGPPKVLEKSRTLETANCPLSWRNFNLGWGPNRGMSPLFLSMFKKLAGNQPKDEF